MCPSTSSTDPVPPSAALLLEVGYIAKAHGLKGEVIVRLTTNRDERVSPGARFSTDVGEFEILSSTPHQDRWIVALAGVRDRNAAEALRGVVLRAEALVDEDALWVHELIGREVVDTHGRSFGLVAAVESNPASDLLVLEDQHLVPLTFVVDQSRGGPIVVDPPAGLLD